MSETTNTKLMTSATTKIIRTEKDENFYDRNNGQMLVENPIEEEDDITSEDLAPDGGWGWMIAMAMVVVLITTSCASPSFTIVFGDFFAAVEQAGAVLTLLNSVFMLSYSLSGISTTALLKQYSMKNVGVIAAILFAVPNILSAFVSHVWQMALIFMIQGMGFGIMITICNANFNAFWVKKRSKVMSGAQVIVGLGGIVYPLLIEKMMNIYGPRGTAALIGVLSLNCIIGMMLMHPVDWHRRDPDEVRKERAKLADESRKLLSERLQEKPASVAVGGGKFVHPVLANRRSTIHVAQVFAKPSRCSSLTSLKEAGGGQHEVSLLIESFRARVASDVENCIRARSRSGTDRGSMTKRMSHLSATSIGNIARVGTTFVELPHKTERKNRKLEPSMEKQKDEIEEKPSGIMGRINDLFELSLLKDRSFLSTILGIGFVFVSDGTFASMLPMMMTDRGYTRSDSALTITVAATAELCSRIFLAVFTLLVDARPKTLFFFSMIFMGFAKTCFFYFEDTLIGVLMSVAMIGFVRSWLFVPQPLVVLENFPVEKYAAAYGIFTLVSGITMIVFGPVVGFIKDLTNSFDICQIVLVALNCMFIIPWGMEFLAIRRKNWKEKNDLKQNVDFQKQIESQSSG